MPIWWLQLGFEKYCIPSRALSYADPSAEWRKEEQSKGVTEQDGQRKELWDCQMFSKRHNATYTLHAWTHISRNPPMKPRNVEVDIAIQMRGDCNRKWRKVSD